MFPTRGSTGRREKARQKQLDLSGTPSADELLRMIFPRNMAPRRGNRGILTAYHDSPTFQVVTQRVAESMAQIPFWVTREGEAQEDHAFSAILRSPNDVFSGYTYRWLQQHYMDLLGESIDVIFRGEDGQPQFYPVPPTAVTVETGRQQGGRRYRVRLGDLDETYVPERILHIRRPNLLNPYGRGTGTGRAVADEVELSEYVTKHTKAEFYNGARPDFFVYLPGAGADQANRFKEEWRKKYSGVQNSGQPAVLGEDPEEVIIKELSRSLADMGASEFKELENEIIRRAFGVPPEIVGVITNSNRATITEAMTILGRFVLKPRATFWASEWQHKVMPLVGEPGDIITFEDPDPGDQEHRRELLKDHPNAFTINEARAEAGKPPREDGDRYMAPGEGLPDAGPIEGEVEQRSQERGDNVIYHIKFGDSGAHRKQPEDQAQQVADALQPEALEAELSPEAEEKLRGFMAEMAGEIPGIGDPEDLFFMLDPRVRDYIKDFGGDRIVGINATTQEDIRGVIDEALREGVNPRRIRDQVGQYVDDIIPNRGEVIARTEMLHAQNYGRHNTMKVSGVVEYKKWLATSDSRTRPSHNDMHGQVQPLDKPFESPDGFTAMYPGDFGIAEMDIQCRCTTRAHFPEIENLAAPEGRTKQAPSDDEVIKAFVKSYESAVDEFRRSVVRAMKKQFEEEVFPRFDQVFHQELAS